MLSLNIQILGLIREDILLCKWCYKDCISSLGLENVCFIVSKNSHYNMVQYVLLMCNSKMFYILQLIFMYSGSCSFISHVLPFIVDYWLIFYVPYYVLNMITVSLFLIQGWEGAEPVFRYCIVLTQYGCLQPLCYCDQILHKNSVFLVFEVRCLCVSIMPMHLFSCDNIWNTW
jgi:hypothetical protein